MCSRMSIRRCLTAHENARRVALHSRSADFADGDDETQVYQNYSTRRLLVSEWVDGTKLTDCGADEINYLTGIGADCFLFQLLELGKFHGDPHPGATPT